MRRWIAIALAGCTTAEPTMITTKRLVGAYHLAYAPADGEPFDIDRERTVFNSPTTSPECCLSLWRRTRSTLELLVGGRLATVRIYITNVLAAAPQLLELGPANTRAFFSYRGTESSLELSGLLDLGVFHCEDEPNELGCALIGKGAWSLESADGEFSTNGWFEAADSVGPLTF